MNEVNIGEAIDGRLKDLRMTKAQFSKLIGMPQQNINRILKSKHITTDKLVQISEVLKYNFFKLYCDDNGPISAIASGNSSIAAVNSDVLTADQERVKYLEQILAEKERLIQFLLKDSDKKPMG